MLFRSDRIESFVTDIHARDHRVKGKIAVKNDGTIVAFEIDDLTGIGPYSMYPRTSGIEANQVVNMIGGPYRFDNYRAVATVVFQNKNMMCQYRAVGHPIMCAVTEGSAWLSMSPTATVFAVMPASAFSSAKCRMKPICPPLPAA